MILNLIRWFRGYVVFKVVGRFPERFINLCMRHGRFVFSVKPEDDGFYASLLVCDYRNIRKTARKASVRLKITQRHGFPFYINSYRKRSGLIVGMALFLIFVLLMQNFVWTIEINGINTLSESAIIETLREEGLYTGVFKGNKDLGALQRSVMQRIDTIGWMSINLIGTKAEVEIKEKELKPEIILADVPCNIKADMDGLILRMDTKYGTAVVAEGSAVIKGSLLVSGVTENPSGAVRIVRADACVIARTHRSHNFSVKKAGGYNAYEKLTNRYKLNAFWLSIPLNLEPVSGDYSSRLVTKNCVLNNTSMPLGFTTEHCVSYKLVPYTLDFEQAKIALDTEDYLCRLFELSECETLGVEKYYRETMQDYELSIVYECTEDIAQSENIVVN